jgi:hypothetical protein
MGGVTYKQGFYAYPRLRQQRQPHDNPTSLARAQRVKVVDLKAVQYLQYHDGGVPVRELLRADRTGAAVTEQVDSHEVDGRRQGRVCELWMVQVTGCHEGVYKDEGWLQRIVVVGHLVGGVDAAEMGDLDHLYSATHVNHSGRLFPETGFSKLGVMKQPRIHFRLLYLCSRSIWRSTKCRGKRRLQRPKSSH